MARVSVALYEEENLPVGISREQFSFGEVVYLTIGGITTADTVVLHLHAGQMALLAAAIQAFHGEGQDDENEHETS